MKGVGSKMQPLANVPVVLLYCRYAQKCTRFKRSLCKGYYFGNQRHVISYVNKGVAEES
jgi:hypothetical protein